MTHLDHVALMPRRVWEVATLALVSLTEAERQPGRFHINMNRYYHKKEGKKLWVCHSGAVMTFVLGSSDEANVGPSDFEIYYQRRLRCIDRLGIGDVSNAVGIVYRGEHRGQERIEGIERILKQARLEVFAVPEYGIDPKGYKDAYRELAHRLKELRL